jgi:hypothetical protein
MNEHRKKIYRMRYFVTKWSNRLAQQASQTGKPQLYLQLARLMLSVYHGLAYHNGDKEEMQKRWRGLGE